MNESGLVKISENVDDGFNQRECSVGRKPSAVIVNILKEIAVLKILHNNITCIILIKQVLDGDYTRILGIFGKDSCLA